MAANNKESNKSTRQKAAAARAEQLSQERRKERMTRLIIGIGAAVAVIVIIGGAVFYSNSNSKPSGTATADPNAALPKTVISQTYAIPYKVDAKTNLPLVQVWLDPQCPACKQFATSGPEEILRKGADENKINLQFRPTTFLDEMLKNDSSAQAVSALGCALDQDKGTGFMDALYANQPQEGKGFSQADLISFGKTAGITGEAFTTYEKCVQNSTYLGWAANSTQQYNELGIKGTPTVTVNGKEFPMDGVTPQNFIQKIQEAAK